MARRITDEDEEEEDEDRPRKRGKKKQVKEKRSFLDQLSRELKKSVIAIVLLGVSIILVLALFDKAGPACHYAYIGLVKAFGWGYYLLPATTLVLSLVFLAHHDLEWLAPPLFGGAAFILAALGAIDVVFPEKAGFVGIGMGLIEKPFGYQASLVIMGVIMLAGFIIALDLPLHIKRRRKEEELKKPQPVAENGTDVNAAVGAAEDAAKAAAAEEKKKDKDVEPQVAPEAEMPKMDKKPVVFKDYVPPPLSLLISSMANFFGGGK